MTTVALVGSRGLAPALCHLLTQKNHKVLWWQPDVLGDATLDLDHDAVERVELDVLADTPVIIFCVPLEHVRSVGLQIGSVISGRHVVVHCTRSLESDTFVTTSSILRDLTPTHRFGFLTGPVRQKDVEKGLLGAGIVASAFPEIHEIFEELLVSPSFRLYRNHDILGAELAASYARVLAFVLGVAQGMKQGPSIQSTIFARGLAEMSKFVGVMGGKPETVFGMSGTGTLYAELQSPGSLGFQLGLETSARGMFDVAHMVETFGVAAEEFCMLISTLTAAMARHNAGGHILLGAHAMVVDKLPTMEAAASLMSLPVLED